jgi:hypothetical protein
MVVLFLPGVSRSLVGGIGTGTLGIAPERGRLVAREWAQLCKLRN